MKHLKLELSKAQEAFKTGNAERKELLISLYGKEHFLFDIKDRVTDYESACKELGLKPLTEADFGILPKEDQKKYFNRHVLTIGIRALNEGWIPDFHDHGRSKWYNYPFTDGKNGFSFGCSGGCSGCSAGSDLYLKDQTLALYAQKIFKQNYLDYSF